MKTLAVFFPGVGYTTTKPLFYYAKKVMAMHHIETIELHFESLQGDPFVSILHSGEDNTSKVFKQSALAYVSKAYELAKEQLSTISFSDYDRILFVGKSVGTIVSSLYAQKKQLSPIFILLTPMEYAFQFLPDTSQKGIVFAGTKDRLVSITHLQDSCKHYGMTLHTLEGGNHSLETGNVFQDISYLSAYTSTLDIFLSDLDKSIYDIAVTDRNNHLRTLSDYRGKVLLIVNTATGCGFTPQYTQLETLYGSYKKRGLVILDFPCNQFANQAPGTSAEIYSFCTSRYHITFPQYAKIDVNGENEHPLYTHLKARKGFAGFDLDTQDGVYLAKKLAKEDSDYESKSDIKWNFTKFLIDRQGHVVKRYEPTAPFDVILQDIEELL